MVFSQHNGGLARIKDVPLVLDLLLCFRSKFSSVKALATNKKIITLRSHFEIHVVPIVAGGQKYYQNA